MRKTFLGPGADRWPISFSEGFINISEGESESEVTQSCLTLCNLMDCSHQAPPSMGFSRQEYWGGLPFPSPGDLPDPGMEPRSPTLQADVLTSEPIWGQLIRSAFHRSAVSLSLKCFSSDSDNCPDVGIRPLLQFPHRWGQVQSYQHSCFPP